MVKVSREYFRPNEVDILIGNSSKARKKLKWKYDMNIEELVKIMVNYDLKYNDYGEDLS